MPYIINQQVCIQCGSCAPFCKNGAIDWIDHQYVIDPQKCEMCGTCLEYCPIDNTIIENRALDRKLPKSVMNHN